MSQFQISYANRKLITTSCKVIHLFMCESSMCWWLSYQGNSIMFNISDSLDSSVTTPAPAPRQQAAGQQQQHGQHCTSHTQHQPQAASLLLRLLLRLAAGHIRVPVVGQTQDPVGHHEEADQHGNAPVSNPHRQLQLCHMDFSFLPGNKNISKSHLKFVFKDMSLSIKKEP